MPFKESEKKIELIIQKCQELDELILDCKTVLTEETTSALLGITADHAQYIPIKTDLNKIIMNLGCTLENEGNTSINELSLNYRASSMGKAAAGMKYDLGLVGKRLKK